MSIASVQITDRSFTINEFCEAERISRGALYELWRQGCGPRFYWNGTHRRITADARRDWQHQREAAAIASGEV
jgi:hypothetical protein